MRASAGAASKVTVKAAARPAGLAGRGLSSRRRMRCPAAVRAAPRAGAGTGDAVASRYPQGRLLGVEADHDNALLARRNLAHLSNRCILEEAAVWYCDETLTLA